MEIVAAIDSFKGSMTSVQAGKAAAKGIHKVDPEAKVHVRPLADGGEGTVEALVSGMNGTIRKVSVTGPIGKTVVCEYGVIENTDGKTGEKTEEKTAVIEIAKAAGLTLLSEEERNPLYTTTYGVGEVIKDAVRNGCRKFIVGIGGSATNDGGIGMLQALGFRFLDAYGKQVGEGAQALGNVAQVDCAGADPRLVSCRFRIACDVTNPLCGKNGATYVFGPQKGVTEEMKQPLDAAMARYGQAVAKAIGTDYMQEPGAGAAGGLGFAFRSFLKAELTPGIELILNAVGLEQELTDADYAITGEGKLDFQTAMGKAPVGVAKLAKKHGVRVLAFAGSVTKEARACNAAGIDAFFSIVRGVTTLEEAMKKEVAAENMRESVEQVFRAVAAVTGSL